MNDLRPAGYVCTLQDEPMRLFARAIQKLSDTKYCAVLLSLARASGFRDWGQMLGSPGFNTSYEHWRHALRREFGDAVVDQIDEGELQLWHERGFVPASAQTTSVDALFSGAYVGGRRRPSPYSVPVVYKRSRRTVSAAAP